MRRCVSSLVVALAFLPFSRAAVVVIANMTDQTVRFEVTVRETEHHALAAGESKVIPCGRSVKLTSEFGTTNLEAWSAYAFTRFRGKVQFTGIELAGKPVPNDDVPIGPSPVEPRPFKVRIFVDDANPFTEPIWSKKVGGRWEIAAAVLKTSLGMNGECLSRETWKSEPEATTMDELFADFVAKVKPEKGVLMVGFTSRLRVAPTESVPTSLTKTQAPFGSHILIREGVPKSESEQGEFLASEIARHLGAIHSPDPNSLLRPKLGDGKAQRASFAIRIDPLNLLAIHLWQSDKGRTWQELKPATAARLARVYETLMKAEPSEKPSEAITGLIASTLPADPIADAVRLGNPMAPAVTLLPGQTREQAIRRVLKGIAIRAADNAAKPAAERLTKDELTVMLVKTAADLALAEEESMQAPAFAVALGIGLDDSTILRNNPLTKGLCEVVESNEEFAARTKAVGTASLHGRRDLAQHFAVSCALAELVGLELARQAGLAKELRDMSGTSGFSFADLAVDYAGVELVERLKADKLLLSRVRQSFEVNRFVPDVKDLEEGLNATAFAAKFGGVTDARFRAESAKLRERVKGLGAYVK